MGTRRALVLFFLAGYLVFLLDLALFRFRNAHPTPNFIPLHSMMGDWKTGGRELVVNFLGNVIAFLPIGMIPALAWPRRFRAGGTGIICMALSLTIETVQYASGRRVADVDDVILNTLGGVLGYYMLSRSSFLTRLAGGNEKTRHARGPDETPGVPRK